MSSVNSLSLVPSWLSLSVILNWLIYLMLITCPLLNNLKFLQCNLEMLCLDIFGLVIFLVLVSCAYFHHSFALQTSIQAVFLGATYFWVSSVKQHQCIWTLQSSVYTCWSAVALEQQLKVNCAVPFVGFHIDQCQEGVILFLDMFVMQSGARLDAPP